MSPDDVAGGTLIGPLLSMALFGFYTGLLGFTYWTMRRSARRQSPAMWAVIVVFVINIIQVVASTLRTYQKYIVYPRFSSGDYEYSREGLLLSTIDDSCFTFASYIADAVLLWRLWIIWSRNTKVALFALAYVLVGGTSSLFTIVLECLIVRHGATDGLMSIYLPFSTAALGYEIGANWIITGCIIGKLYRVGCSSDLYRRKVNVYWGVILALVESGALFTITMGAYLVLDITNSRYKSFLGYSMIRIVGLSPLLILLQLGLGYTQPHDDVETSSAAVASGPLCRRPQQRQDETVIEFEMKPVKNISENSLPISIDL